jgi:hypothetical protein
VAVRVEDAPHLEELEVALEFGSEVCGGEVEPVGAGGGFFDLVKPVR